MNSHIHVWELKSVQFEAVTKAIEDLTEAILLRKAGIPHESVT
jgi:hypothetical protein